MRSSALRRSPPSYFSLRAQIPESSMEQVEHLLHQAGAIGLEIRDSGELNRAKQVKISDCALDELDEVFDLVVANILANTLVELSSHLAKLTAEKLILSGLLIGQESEVARAFRQSGLTVSGRRTRREWLRLDFRRR